MSKKIIAYLTITLVLLTGSVNVAHGLPDRVGIIKTKKFTPPANISGICGYIELNHQLQERNLCVPTSASIVLQYFGQTATPRELKVLSRGKKYDPNKRFKDFTLTMFNDLIGGISTLGISWKQMNWANNKAGAELGLAEIRQEIDKSNPVLIDTNLYGGHTFIVNGYDENARYLIIMDPNIPAPGIRVISYKDIEKIWNSRGVGYNGRGAVFTEPKR